LGSKVRFLNRKKENIQEKAPEPSDPRGKKKSKETGTKALDKIFVRKLIGLGGRGTRIINK